MEKIKIIYGKEKFFSYFITCKHTFQGQGIYVYIRKEYFIVYHSMTGTTLVIIRTVQWWQDVVLHTVCE